VSLTALLAVGVTYNGSNEEVISPFAYFVFTGQSHWRTLA